MVVGWQTVSLFLFNAVDPLVAMTESDYFGYLASVRQRWLHVDEKPQSSLNHVNSWLLSR